MFCLAAGLGGWSVQFCSILRRNAPGVITSIPRSLAAVKSPVLKVIGGNCGFQHMRVFRVFSGSSPEIVYLVSPGLSNEQSEERKRLVLRPFSC